MRRAKSPRSLTLASGAASKTRWWVREPGNLAHQIDQPVRLVNVSDARRVRLHILGKRGPHQIRIGAAGFADEELLRLDQVLQKLPHGSSIFRRLKSKLIGRNLIRFIDQAFADFTPAFDDVFN